MAFVEPLKGRAKIIDLGDRVMIEIPTRPKGCAQWGIWLFVFLFLTGWLVGWAAGEIFVLRGLSLLLRSEGPLRLVIWLIGWTAGGIFFICVWAALLLMLVGREIIMVSPMSLDIVIRPIGRLRRYRLSEISNLQVLEEGRAGVIAFDYGASTVRFGLTIDPAEAWQIVTLLRERFGQYMADNKAGGMEDGVR